MSPRDSHRTSDAAIYSSQVQKQKLLDATFTWVTVDHSGRLSHLIARSSYTTIISAMPAGVVHLCLRIDSPLLPLRQLSRQVSPRPVGRGRPALRGAREPRLPSRD